MSNEKPPIHDPPSESEDDKEKRRREKEAEALGEVHENSDVHDII